MYLQRRPNLSSTSTFCWIFQLAARPPDFSHCRKRLALQKRVSPSRPHRHLQEATAYRTLPPAPDCVQLQFVRRRGIRRNKLQTEVPSIGRSARRASRFCVVVRSHSATDPIRQARPGPATRHRQLSTTGRRDRQAISPTCNRFSITHYCSTALAARRADLPLSANSTATGLALSGESCLSAVQG